MDATINNLAIYAPFSLTAAIVAGIFGLIIGSFLNVVIGRLPVILQQQWRAECAALQGQSVPDTSLSLAKPGSHCPHCKHAVRWYDNIPILSWLLLKARCRDCQTPISIRYPMVELFTALVFAAIGWQWGLLSTQAYFYAVAAALLICLFFIDLDEMLLPDQLTLLLLWVGLLFSIGGSSITPTNAIIGAIAGYLSLWSVFWAFKLLTGRDGMGYGDFKLLAAIGAWVGWQLLPVVVIFAAVTGAVIGLIWQGINRNQRGNPIPFGPFLIIGGISAWGFGEQVMRSYWDWLVL
ncbi:prepilin peptidase [Thalassospira xiamenensis]|nr:prepilin peptidase [Thalassospira xiamenensis]